MIPREFGDLYDESSVRAVGESGFVKSLAPSPFKEYSVPPKLLVARTLAVTLDPHDRLNGAERRKDTGIVQDFEVKISVFDPSQFIRSAVKL